MRLTGEWQRLSASSGVIQSGAMAAALEPGRLTEFCKRTTGGLEAGATNLPHERQSAHGGASVSAPNEGSGLQNQLDGCSNLPLNRNCQTPNLSMLVRSRGVAARHERRPVRQHNAWTPKVVPECVVLIIDRTCVKSRPASSAFQKCTSPPPLTRYTFLPRTL
jgi:hypothetical protein